jgi:hypothetical protein
LSITIAFSNSRAESGTWRAFSVDMKTGKKYSINHKENIRSNNNPTMRGEFTMSNLDHEEKLRALDAAVMQIEKQYGKGSIMKLGDPTTQMNVETIPTGS